MIYTKLCTKLPSHVGGFTLCDEEGDYTIFLNARYSYEDNKQTVQHEIEHIRKGDFYSADEADYIEWSRHFDKASL